MIIDLSPVLTKENAAILHVIADITEKMQNINFVSPSVSNYMGALVKHESFMLQYDLSLPTFSFRFQHTVLKVWFLADRNLKVIPGFI